MTRASPPADGNPSGNPAAAKLASQSGRETQSPISVNRSRQGSGHGSFSKQGNAVVLARQKSDAGPDNASPLPSSGPAVVEAIPAEEGSALLAQLRQIHLSHMDGAGSSAGWEGFSSYADAMSSSHGFSAINGSIRPSVAGSGTQDGKTGQADAKDGGAQALGTPAELRFAVRQYDDDTFTPFTFTPQAKSRQKSREAKKASEAGRVEHNAMEASHEEIIASLMAAAKNKRRPNTAPAKSSNVTWDQSSVEPEPEPEHSVKGSMLGVNAFRPERHSHAVRSKPPMSPPHHIFERSGDDGSNVVVVPEQVISEHEAIVVRSEQYEESQVCQRRGSKQETPNSVSPPNTSQSNAETKPWSANEALQKGSPPTRPATAHKHVEIQRAEASSILAGLRVNAASIIANGTSMATLYKPGATSNNSSAYRSSDFVAAPPTYPAFPKPSKAESQQRSTQAAAANPQQREFAPATRSRRSQQDVTTMFCKAQYNPAATTTVLSTFSRIPPSIDRHRDRPPVPHDHRTRCNAHPTRCGCFPPGALAHAIERSGRSRRSTLGFSNRIQFMLEEAEGGRADAGARANVPAFLRAQRRIEEVEEMKRNGAGDVATGTLGLTAAGSPGDVTRILAPPCTFGRVDGKVFKIRPSRLDVEKSSLWKVGDEAVIFPRAMALSKPANKDLQAKGIEDILSSKDPNWISRREMPTMTSTDFSAIFTPAKAMPPVFRVTRYSSNTDWGRDTMQLTQAARTSHFFVADTDRFEHRPWFDDDLQRRKVAHEAKIRNMVRDKNVGTIQIC